MLGKLLKHEFRATGRTMLPVYGAVVLLAALANLSIRIMDRSVHTLVTVFCGLIIAAFIVCIIAAGIMTVVMMVKRFYSNYLKDEGYLMHTLPVSVHGLVWSKMIVSVVWFVVTFLVIWLVILLTVLIQTGTNLGELLAGFPSWAEIRAALANLAEHGIRAGDLWMLALEFLLFVIVGGLFTCLHFYAAMSLGHMFSKDKILLSIVFFVGISFVLSLMTTGYGAVCIDILDANYSMHTAAESIRFGKAVLGEMLLVELLQSAVLYAATVLSLKKGLNLA